MERGSRLKTAGFNGGGVRKVRMLAGLAGVGRRLGRCLCELRYRCFHLTGVQRMDLLI